MDVEIERRLGGVLRRSKTGVLVLSGDYLLVMADGNVSSIVIRMERTDGTRELM